MKKIILLLTSFVSLNSFSQENSHEEPLGYALGDLRANQDDMYLRLYLEVNINDHWGFTSGGNADARGLIHVEGTYKILPQLKLALGIADHRYQGKFHPSFGALYKKEFKNHLELEGYARLIFNKMNYFGSEIEFKYIFREKYSLGIVTEIEAGKAFLSWEEARDTEHWEKENVFLGGLCGTIKITDHWDLRGLYMIGTTKTQEEKGTFSSKLGFGTTYKF